MTEAAGTLRSTPLRQVPHRDLPDEGRPTYVLRQRFSYTYDAPVRDLDHRLVVVPPRMRRRRRQRRRGGTRSPSSRRADARTTHRRDAAGSLRSPRSRVRTGAGRGRVRGGRAMLVPSVSGRAPTITAHARRRSLHRLAAAARDRRLTTADAAIRKRLRWRRWPTRTTLATADPVLRVRARGDPLRQHGVTSVSTTAAEALLPKPDGVCQDAAHVMIALCRAIRAADCATHLRAPARRGRARTPGWKLSSPTPTCARAAARSTPGNGCRVVRELPDRRHRA